MWDVDGGSIQRYQVILSLLINTSPLWCSQTNQIQHTPTSSTDVCYFISWDVQLPTFIQPWNRTMVWYEIISQIWALVLKLYLCNVNTRVGVAEIHRPFKLLFHKSHKFVSHMPPMVVLRLKNDTMSYKESDTVLNGGLKENIFYCGLVIFILP